MSKTKVLKPETRLQKDYMRLKQDPVPYVTAEPLPENILEWHYVLSGPEQSPYEGGYYHGKLVFPREFPFRPPSIYMITPNGRFKTNTRLCLSISDFHPETWHPSWSVSTILTALLSFMLEDTPTEGSFDAPDQDKRKYAERSLELNLKNKTFCELFPDTVREINTRLVLRQEEINTRLALRQEEINTRLPLQQEEEINTRLAQEEMLKNKQKETTVNPDSNSTPKSSSSFSTVVVLIGIFVFTYTVRCVLQNLAK